MKYFTENSKYDKKLQMIEEILTRENMEIQTGPLGLQIVFDDSIICELLEINSNNSVNLPRCLDSELLTFGLIKNEKTE